MIGLGIGGSGDKSIAALRAQTSLGAQPTTMSSGPTLTNSSSTVTPTLTGTTYYFNNAARFRMLNGEWILAGAGYPDNNFGRCKNVSYDLSTSYFGVMGAAEFDFTGDQIELCTKGMTGANWRLMVDGQVTNNTYPVYPGDGSFRWTLVDFGSIATRRLRLESIGSGQGYFSGARVKTGQSISATTGTYRRLITVGDSFTEGTGASNYAGSLATYIAQELGYKDFWNSGSGGTGYMQANGGLSRINMFDRWTTDVVNRSPDHVIIAMGYNDVNDGNDATIQSTLVTKLTELFTARPSCLVSVFGSYDGNAPGAPVTGYTSLNAAIANACAGFPRVRFFPLQGVSFTKSADTIHPDIAGHVTLGKAMYNQMAAAYGLHAVA